MPWIAAIAAAFLAWLPFTARRRRPWPAQSAIISDRKSTVIAADGAVKSVQSARLTLPSTELHRLWSAESLERLGRTYWQFLGRVTLHLIRVIYGADSSCSVVLLVRPLCLLRFEQPQYERSADHGQITWRIRDGLLVARKHRGHGWLRLEVRDLSEGADSSTVRIDVEVANFYPAIASGFGTAIYQRTQALIHVLVTHGFLRSLASLKLADD